MSNLLSTSEIIEKKSKFLGFLYELESIEEVKEIYEQLQREHKKSNHICYGGKINDEPILKNDGEVGQPSRVMFQIIEHKNLNSHLLIVVRYFGGVKLGVGGVSRAFRKTASQCIEEYLSK